MGKSRAQKRVDALFRAASAAKPMRVVTQSGSDGSGENYFSPLETSELRRTDEWSEFNDDLESLLAIPDDLSRMKKAVAAEEKKERQKRTRRNGDGGDVTTVENISIQGSKRARQSKSSKLSKEFRTERAGMKAWLASSTNDLEEDASGAKAIHADVSSPTAVQSSAFEGARDDETLYDARGFVDFVDDETKWPRALTVAVDNLHSLQQIIAATGSLAHVVSPSCVPPRPYWSARGMGCVAGHFPPEDAVGDRSIITLAVAKTGRSKGRKGSLGSLIPANPCVRLFNYLLDATTGKKTKSTTTKYVCRNGTEATVKLSSEAVWLLSNDFVDLLPPLSSSRAGGAAIRAIEKELGKDFLWTLMERFATVLEERSKFLKKRAGVASGATPANVILWGAGTSDGKRHTGVLSDIHALLQAMGVKHTKLGIRKQYFDTAWLRKPARSSTTKNFRRSPRHA